MDKIGIIILSYNNSVDTIECLNSLNAVDCDQCNFEIIIVDNSKTDLYAQEIQKACPNISVVIRCENNGYSAGNNIGIKRAISDGCEFIIVLNNDTTVDSLFYKPLIEELKQNKNQIVAPIIYNYYSKKVWSSGGRFRRLLGDYCMLYDKIDKKRKASFISGCCFATTKYVFEKIGYLNEDYFMYCEDTDFCKRASEFGCKMLVLPDSIIFHKAGISSKKNNAFQLYYIYRNRIYFAYSMFRGVYRLYAVFVNKFRALLKALLYLIRRKKDYYHALIFAIKDGKSILDKRRF